MAKLKIGIIGAGRIGNGLTESASRMSMRIIMRY
jgi:phosphoglycerate dehydrogenase-like enzyme